MGTVRECCVLPAALYTLRTLHALCTFYALRTTQVPYSRTIFLHFFFIIADVALSLPRIFFNVTNAVPRNNVRTHRPAAARAWRG